MEQVKAPEKIYYAPYGDMRVNHPITDNDIEYTRTDAFIEKAEKFIYSALNDGIMGTANIEDFMRLFKIYMKEE